MKRLFCLITLLALVLCASAQNTKSATLAFDSVSAVSRTLMNKREIEVCRKSSVYPKDGPKSLCDSLSAWICDRLGGASRTGGGDIPSLVGKGGQQTVAYDAERYARCTGQGMHPASSTISISKIYEDADYVTLACSAETNEGGDAPTVRSYEAVTFSKASGNHVGWGLVKGLSQDKVLDRIKRGLKDAEGADDGLLAFLAAEGKKLRMPKAPPYMVERGVEVTYRAGEYDDQAHTCLIRRIADNFEAGGVRYAVTSRKSRRCAVAEQQGKGPKGALVIPETVSAHGLKYKVTAIGDGAFAHSSALTSVSIPETVKSIGEGAFRGCSALSEVSLPPTLTRIAPQTFSDCSSLEEIELPRSLKYIGTSAFGRCSALRSILIPEEVDEVDFLAFEACASLRTVTIQGGETDINFCAFEECDGITAVYDLATTPQDISATTFPAEAVIYVLPGCKMDFMSESNWRESNIREINEVEAEGVTYAITSADDHTCRLVGTEGAVARHFAVPTYINYRGLRLSVTDIAPRAFAGCESLETIEVPATITAVGDEAFDGCSALQRVVLQGDSTQIGSGLFQGCSALHTVELPSALSALPPALFAGCTGLQRVVLPPSLGALPPALFDGCTALSDVALPSGVTAIDSLAFRGCTALTSIDLPAALAEIGHSAFEGCTSLEGIGFPAALRVVAPRAFAHCSRFAAITIPEGVVTLGSEAFTGCPLLLTVTNLAPEPQLIPADVFDKYGQLFVPSIYIKEYKKAHVWRKFKIKKGLTPAP